MFGRIDNAASTLRANDLFCENEELHVDCSFYYYLKNLRKFLMKLNGTLFSSS